MAPSPHIDSLSPAAALPGGDISLYGNGFFPGESIPQVLIGGVAVPVLVASNRFLLARVPDVTGPGSVEVALGPHAASAAQSLEVGVLIAENLHPVCNPVTDPDGNIVVTLSGSRGQKTPVSLFKVDANYTLKAWSSAVTNPSGLAVDRSGTLFVSSRLDGAVYRMAPNGTATLFAEGLGVATGLAFDRDENLYVGDRSGTIFKIDQSRSTFVFATLEASIAAYHLAFGPDQYLYVTGPSTSSHDAVWRISPTGRAEPFFRGLGRPQGLAFDANGSLLVVASYRGRRGIVCISPDQKAEVVLSGNNLVGLAFASGLRPALIVATTNALHNVAWPVGGWPLLPPVGD